MQSSLPLRALRALRTPQGPVLRPGKYISRPASSSSSLSSLRQRNTIPQIPQKWLNTLPSRSQAQPQVPKINIKIRSLHTTPPTQFPYQRPNYNRFNGSGSSRTGRASLFNALLQKSKPHHFVLIGLGISGVYFYNTDVVEMTGRRRFNCVSAQRELEMGEQSYREVLQQERGKVLSEYHPLTKSVDRVLRRLVKGMSADEEGDLGLGNWKVHVIKDDGVANAFVLPGGKVFVYTGILPICQDEDGLAAVLGHEIAHVIARHPAERMSTSFLTLGTVFLVSLLFDVSGQLSSMLVNLMWSLPNSRTQEAEADNIGLIMMSKACYNPEAAVRLWHRMQQQEKGAPPQFMSTHPSSYNREEAIRGWLERAKSVYVENGCGEIGGFLPSFQSAFRSHTSGF